MSEKKIDMGAPLDLVIYRQYELYGVKVQVKIDRLQKQVSLVSYDQSEKEFHAKEWVFAERKLEYMNGWIAILRAMELAVTEGKKELEKFADEDTQALIKIHIALNKIKLDDKDEE